MLSRLNPQAIYCLERADEIRQMGERESDPQRQKKYFDTEWRWRYLAESYDIADRGQPDSSRHLS